MPVLAPPAPKLFTEADLAEVERLVAQLSRAGLTVGRKQELARMQGLGRRVVSTNKPVVAAKAALLTYLKGFTK